MDRELWAEIPGYPGYMASTLGRIRGKSGRILALYQNSKGYMTFSAVPRVGVKVTEMVHSCVLKAFMGEAHGKVSRHLNGIPNDNRLSNLTWGTSAENAQDAKDHGTFVSGSKNGMSKLTDEEVEDIKALMRGGMSYQAIADQYGVTKQAVYYSVKKRVGNNG